MKHATLVAVALFACTTALAAQPQEAPKPGPDQQKMAAFVGNWTFEGDMKPGPLGPGGKVTGTDRIQWLPGNFFIERRFNFKGPMGEIQGLEVLGYDAASKGYTYNAFDNMGGTGNGTMTVSGSTWNATGTMKMGPQTIHERCKLAFSANATVLTISCEMSADGKKFAPTLEGKATKGK
jgi:hypothetical protein